VWAAGNLAWLVAASAVVLAIVKVSRVAHLNPATAVAIVNASGPVQVALGVLTSAAGGAAVATFGLAAFFAWGRLRSGVNVGAAIVALAAGLVAVVQLVALIPALAFGVIGLGVVVITGLFKRGQEGAAAGSVRSAPQRPIWQRQTLGFVALVVAWVLLALGAALGVDDKMWLPAERVTLASGQRMTAYVVSTSDQWTTLLRDRDRAILFVRPTEIRSRALCSISKRRSERSIAAVIGGDSGSAKYPPCA
jgi:hypothetical protein